jgi:hypothetical protein
LEDHVFQFDFLNDDFNKLPQRLQNIINDEEKRKKLVIYINPPYAETTTKTTITGKGKNKTSVAQNKIHDKYASVLKKANHELFAQFLTRIYCEIPTAWIANFSTLKNLQSDNFQDFRKFFRAKLEKIFIVPADTFDNVKGEFPIGFFTWNTDKKEKFEEITADVYDRYGVLVQNKNILSNDSIQSINQWSKTFDDTKNEIIGLIVSCPPDFQHNNQVAILSKQQKRYCFSITKQNLIQFCIYFAVRHCIEATWLNDRDQFLYPNDGWKKDLEFQNDCFTYTLFNNNIQSQNGENNWIPFTEQEVDSREKFDSRFMTDFIAGKIKKEKPDLFDKKVNPVVEKQKKLEFSIEAQSVFDAGKVLWRYYHKQPNCNVNASLYDIREHFQGRNEKGKMNNNSENETYMNLITDLREKLRILAKKIEPKVYEYEFLKK